MLQRITSLVMFMLGDASIFYDVSLFDLVMVRGESML